METFEQVGCYIHNGHSLEIYRSDYYWLYIDVNEITRQSKGVLCICQAQADDLFYAEVERRKVWIN